MRFVNSHFCRESYDTFRIPPELISLMRKARSEYVKDVKKSVTPQRQRGEGKYQSTSGDI